MACGGDVVFRVGQVVWGKVKGHANWPAVIVMRDIKERAEGVSTDSGDTYRVWWLENSQHSDLAVKDVSDFVLKFKEGFAKMKQFQKLKRTNSTLVAKSRQAVQTAVELIASEHGILDEALDNPQFTSTQRFSGLVATVLTDTSPFWDKAHQVGGGEGRKKKQTPSYPLPTASEEFTCDKPQSAHSQCSDSSENSEMKGPGWIFRCVTCEIQHGVKEDFSTHSQALQHATRTHPHLPQPQIQEVRWRKLSPSSKTARDQYESESSYSCTGCNQEFISKKRLTRHLLDPKFDHIHGAIPFIGRPPQKAKRSISSRGSRQIPKSMTSTPSMLTQYNLSEDNETRLAPLDGSDMTVPSFPQSSGDGTELSRKSYDKMSVVSRSHHQVDESGTMFEPNVSNVTRPSPYSSRSSGVPEDPTPDGNHNYPNRAPSAMFNHFNPGRVGAPNYPSHPAYAKGFEGHPFVTGYNPVCFDSQHSSLQSAPMIESVNPYTQLQRVVNHHNPTTTKTAISIGQLTQKQIAEIARSQSVGPEKMQYAGEVLVPIYFGSKTQRSVDPADLVDGPPPEKRPYFADAGPSIGSGSTQHPWLNTNNRDFRIPASVPYRRYQSPDVHVGHQNPPTPVVIDLTDD